MQRKFKLHANQKTNSLNFFNKKKRNTTKIKKRTIKKSTKKTLHGATIANPKKNLRYHKQKSKSKKINFKSFLSFLLVLLPILLISTLVAYFVYFPSLFKSNIQNLYSFDSKESCKTLNSEIYSFLFINNISTYPEFYIVLKYRDRTVYQDISTQEFSLHSTSTKSLLRDIFNKNAFFQDTVSASRNIQNIILRDTKIYTEFILYTETNLKFSSIFDSYTTNIFNQIYEYNFNNKLSEIKIFGNICTSEFVNLLDQTKKTDLIYLEDENSPLSYFNFNSIIKEQVRVELINFSGVSNWGNEIKNLLESYGINVIKVSEDLAVKKTKTNYYKINETNSKNTLEMLSYILNKGKQIQPDDKDNIKSASLLFADIYIELGTDVVY